MLTRNQIKDIKVGDVITCNYKPYTLHKVNRAYCLVSQDRTHVKDKAHDIFTLLVRNYRRYSLSPRHNANHPALPQTKVCKKREGAVLTNPAALKATPAPATGTKKTLADLTDREVTVLHMFAFGASDLAFTQKAKAALVTLLKGSGVPI